MPCFVSPKISISVTLPSKKSTEHGRTAYLWLYPWFNVIAMCFVNGLHDTDEATSVCPFVSFWNTFDIVEWDFRRPIWGFVFFFSPVNSFTTRDIFHQVLNDILKDKKQHIWRLLLITTGTWNEKFSKQLHKKLWLLQFRAQRLHAKTKSLGRFSKGSDASHHEEWTLTSCPKNQLSNINECYFCN